MVVAVETNYSSGAFGEVTLMAAQPNSLGYSHKSTLVAVKTLIASGGDAVKTDPAALALARTNFEREIAVQRDCIHANLVCLLGASTDVEPQIMLLEYVCLFSSTPVVLMHADVAAIVFARTQPLFRKLVSKNHHVIRIRGHKACVWANNMCVLKCHTGGQMSCVWSNCVHVVEQHVWLDNACVQRHRHTVMHVNADRTAPTLQSQSELHTRCRHGLDFDFPIQIGLYLRLPLL
jgi:hypothetical protein